MTLATQGEMRQQSLLVAIGNRVSSFYRRVNTRSKERRLRVCESISLGEKRFVAVVQFETQQFLIGGGAQSVNLLTRLGESADFADVLTEWSERQR